jgi:Dolichyl-phosphate-mannose-protein mannosyltransferase
VIAGRPDPTGRSTAAVVMSAILMLAFALRVLGLDFGLPAVYNPDEVSIMSRALAFAKGDLNPHNFLYPTFYFYVLFGWVGGYFAIGRLLGLIPSLDAFQTQFFVDPTGIYLAGRSLSVVCGVVSVVLVYALARRLSGRIAGLSAALFIASAPFAVRDAHYVKHDIPATLAVLAAYLAIVGLDDAGTDSRRRRWLVAAGAACGVAFSTHYYTVFLALPLAVAVITAGRRPLAVAKDLLIALCAAAGVFFVLSPFLVIELRTALVDISANRGIVVDRAVAGGHGLFASARAYTGMLWRDAVGWPVWLLALVGIVALARRSLRRAALVMAFPAAFFLFISNTVPAARYLNPVLPFVAVAAGVAISTIAGLVGPRRWLVAVAIGVLAAIPGAWGSVATGMFFRQTDTRTLALRYFEQQIPAGASVALQPYSVPLTQSRESLVDALQANLGDVRRATTKYAMRLRLNPYPAPSYRTLFLGDGGLDPDKIYVGYSRLGRLSGLQPLRALGVVFVVVKRYNVPAPETLPFLEALEKEGRLLASFSPFRSGAGVGSGHAPEPYLHNTDARITSALERPGPVVEIWRLWQPPS